MAIATSAAETCCLISALTQTAIRQDLAITGAVDQLGHVQAVGGINEKIEGFFDACCDQGLSGTQGVIIPQSNVGDLMLRGDVVQAASEGRFHVYAASVIGDALELLMETPMEDGTDGSLLAKARQRTREFWEMLAHWRPL